MNITEKYNIFVGSVRGVIGNTRCKPDEQAKFNLQDADKSSEITAMEWGRKEDEILVGCKNGAVKVYDTLLDKYEKLDTVGDGAVVGTGHFDENILVAQASGHINVLNENNVHNFKVTTDDGSLGAVVCNVNRKNIIGMGGTKSDFQLWDVETKKCIFKAKSMGHDMLNLPLPTTIRGICFFTEDEKLNACVTKEGCVLLYDERVQRRPVCKFIEPKASFTAIAMAYRQKWCVVGTTKGYMQLIDLRVPSKCMRTYKSCTGSVSGIVCDPLVPIIASVSLDRYLRIHNLETKELLYKEYMKQSLTKLLLKPIIKDECVEKTEISTRDEEYEQLFEEMEAVTDKKLKPIVKDDHAVNLIRDDEYEQLFEEMATVTDSKKRRKRKGKDAENQHNVETTEEENVNIIKKVKSVKKKKKKSCE